MDFESLYNKAHAAGMLAAGNHIPTPMIVQQHENMMNDNSPVVKNYFCSGGVCGFAEIIIKPATCAFVRYLKSRKIGRNYYYGGWSIWVYEFGQSMELKEKYADAFAKVLKEYGINASSMSRMD
jgi:hypothetical protein